MSYTIEGKDLVFKGFEDGISDNPYKGINDMRGMNIVSIPGEASVAFAPSNIALSPFSGTITSFASSVITPNITVGSITTYTAIQFTTTGTLPTGISLATTYYVVNNGGGTFKIYDDCYGNTQRTFTDGTGSGTHAFTSIDMKAIKYFEKNYGFCIDENGRVWSPTSSGVFTFMNNTITNGSGNGLVVYKGSGATLYLFVFRNGQIDYCVVNNVANNGAGITPAWVSGWDPSTGGTTAGAVLNTAVNINNNHEALVGQDNAVYYTDGSYIGSLRERAGSTFDPTSTSTYTFNQKALAIPLIDTAQCLEELGVNLLVGGLYNYVYPWNRSDTNFKLPILIAEKGVTRLLTVNTNTYIFAGKRGRIFVTNGSQAELYKKVPDYLLGIDPVFTFYGVAYNKNQLYFGLSARTNAGVISTTYAGLWAIDLDTKALRVVTLQSTTTATVTAMWSNPYTPDPSVALGFGLATAWKTVNGSDTTQTAGIDTATSSPYTSYVSYVDTEIVPIGQYYNKKTPSNIEFKTSVPLVSGEGIKISYRTNLSEAYTLIGETTEVGVLSDAYYPNFENVQWVQFRAQTKSTASSPSYTRLTEIRVKF